MKKFTLLLLSSLLLLPVAVSAAAFEGTITMKMTTPDTKKDGNMEVVLSLKEGYYRMNMGAQSKDQKGVLGGMIMDLKKEEMIILMNEQKMYMVRPMPKPTKEDEKKDLKAVDDFTVERTGKTETILGYKCEQVLVKSKNSTTEVWATDQLGTYMGTQAGGGGGGGMFGRGRQNNAQVQAWEKVFQGKDFFPLRSISLDSKGKETMRMDVTAIDKRSLPQSEFEPPADFQKFDMSGMLKGAIPGFGK